VINFINGIPVSKSSEVIQLFGHKVGEEFKVSVKRKVANEVKDFSFFVTPKELDIEKQQKEAQFVFQP